MFAIVRISGKQYKVSPGDILEVEALNLPIGESTTFSEVLLVDADGQVSVGDPTVKGASVVAKPLEDKKGDKLEVRRYKSKVRYRKANGMRPHLTRLEIVAVHQPK